MPRQEQYETTVCRLNECGYMVVADERGYMVCRVMNEDDISRAYNLNELMNFADLMQWDKQQRTRNKSAQWQNHS